MSKVLTFSRQFPAHHPKAGQPTNFIRSIWEGLDKLNILHELSDAQLEDDIRAFYEKRNYTPKWHTIRAGNRWKVGNKFSPRVWSGKPYNSKQIIIAPDIAIVKVWPITLVLKDRLLVIDELNYYPLAFEETIAKLALNDGLGGEDLLNWFNKPFTGQIIAWNPEINY